MFHAGQQTSHPYTSFFVVESGAKHLALAAFQPRGEEEKRENEDKTRILIPGTENTEEEDKDPMG